MSSVEPEGDLLVLTFAIDDAYVATWQATRFAHTVGDMGSRLASWLIYGGTIAVGLAAGAVAELSGSVDSATSSWIACGAAVVYYTAALLGWWLCTRAMRIQADATDGDILARKGHATLSARRDGLAYALRDFRGFWPWNEFTEARDDRGVIILLHGASPTLLIPKTAFRTAAEAQAGLTLIADLIRSAAAPPPGPWSQGGRLEEER